MFTISILIFTYLVFVFVITSLILFGCGKLFKVPNLLFKNALLTAILILFVGIIFEVLLFGFHIEKTLINIIFSFISLVITIWIVQKIFAIHISKAIAISLTSAILTVIIFFAVGLFTRAYIFQAFKIPSGSMLNTIQIGDQILVNKYIYKFKPPERGDIVVFTYPVNPAQNHLQRIVAASGDSVQIKDKNLYVNNDLINEEHVIHTDSRILGKETSPRDNFGPVTVPEDSYFVLGDNRDNSNDSRFWGFVNSDLIKGKAFIIYWPWDDNAKKPRLRQISNSLTLKAKHCKNLKNNELYLTESYNHIDL